MEQDSNIKIMGNKIVFVYNADSNFFSKAIDFTHKALSPSTYQCKLCSITYGNLGIKKEWAKFVKALEIEPEFLHKDEFLRKYHSSISDFPAIFILHQSSLKLLVPSDVINKCNSLQELEMKLTLELWSIE